MERISRLTGGVRHDPRNAMSQSTESGEGRSTSSPRSTETLLSRLRGLIGLKTQAASREDLADAIVETAADDFSPQERTMLRNVLQLGEVRVADVMVPRADIVAVESDATLSDLLKLFRTAGHSRLPVYGETLDDPKGMIHIRDFLDFLAGRAEAGAKAARRKRSKAGATENCGRSRHRYGSWCRRSFRRDFHCKLIRPVLYVPHPCRRWIFLRACRPNGRIWRSSSTNTAERMGSSRSRI